MRPQLVDALHSRSCELCSGHDRGSKRRRTISGLFVLHLAIMLSLQSQGNPQLQAVYLRTLPAIRERCLKVHDLAKRGGLQYFDYHPEKEGAVIEFCTSIIEVRPPPALPPSIIDENIFPERFRGKSFFCEQSTLMWLNQTIKRHIANRSHHTVAGAISMQVGHASNPCSVTGTHQAHPSAKLRNANA